MHSLRLLVLVIIGALSACQTDELTESPGISHEPAPAEPDFLIQDGARGGNLHFFFLPPLVPRPSYSGVSDGTLMPVVTVCPVETTTGGCGLAIARFETLSSGAPLGQIRYEPRSESYVTVWDTRRCLTGPCALDPARRYRLEVLVAGTSLGTADLDVVARLRELQQVNWQEDVGLVQGLPLPIRFRIEQGAVAVAALSDVEQTLTMPATVAGQSVELTLPPNTVVNEDATATVGLTVAAAPLPIGTAAVPGTAYDFGPVGTMFSQPITLTVPYDPTILAGVPEARLRLYRVRADGKLESLPGSTVDIVAHTVSGPTDHFSTYVVAEQATAVDIVQLAVSMTAGHTFALDATVDQPGRYITWESLAPGVATVDSFGVVTGIAPGNAFVYASAEGQSDSVGVAVLDSDVGALSFTVTTLGVLPDGYAFGHVGISAHEPIVLGNGLRDTGLQNQDGNPIFDMRPFIHTAVGGLRFLDGTHAGVRVSDATATRAVGLFTDDPGSGDNTQVIWDITTGAIIQEPGRGSLWGINVTDHVVGTCYAGAAVVCANDAPNGSAVIYNPVGTLLHSLPPFLLLEQNGIGEALEVIGFRDQGTCTHAIIWTPASGLLDLTPTLDCSKAAGINAVGQVAGFYGRWPGTGPQSVFFWSEAEGLQLLPNPFPVKPFVRSFVFAGAINDQGEVFGRLADAERFNEARQMIVWTRRTGVWTALVSSTLPTDRSFGNTNKLGQTPALNLVTGELEVWTIQR